jgi:hypothetical protein
MAYFGILVKVLSADILRSKHGPNISRQLFGARGLAQMSARADRLRVYRARNRQLNNSRRAAALGYRKSTTLSFHNPNR